MVPDLEVTLLAKHVDVAGDLRAVTQAGVDLLKDPGAAMSQSLWGEAVFVRDFRRFDQLPPPALLKLAAILHENYGSLDLAALALGAHDKLAATAYHDAYVGHLTRPAN